MCRYPAIIVRIGDIIDNAGGAAQIAIYRAPDLGTTGSLPVAQVLNTLRAHQVIGVDTRDLKEISVTRLARTIEGKEIEAQVARALERRNGLGDAANLILTFDRDPGDVRLDAVEHRQPCSRPPCATTAQQPLRRHLRDRQRERRGATKLRFTGTAIETVEAAVLVRNVERNEVLKSSDVVVERRPKAEVGTDAPPATARSACRPAASSAPARRCRIADLAKPDLVQRDQNVTLIYEAPGLYLTVRGKAMENGTEGDVVNVMNLQSKRTVSGIVTGRGQVSITVATPRPAQQPAQRCHLFARRSRARRARRRRQRQSVSRSKSRVM